MVRLKRKRWTPIGTILLAVVFATAPTLQAQALPAPGVSSAPPVGIEMIERPEGIMSYTTSSGLPVSTSTVTGMAYGDPGFTYGPASRDWVDGVDYYFMENEHVKLTLGTDQLATNDPVDWSDAVTGNNRWGSMTPGHIMDASPKTSMRDNLDYTTFVLSETVGRTWWYPGKMLSLPNYELDDHSVTANGAWDYNSDVEASVTYSLVHNSPMIKMQVELTNTGTSAFNGHLAYIIDPEETLEQQSYVPGWGWRGGQVSEYISSGWNKNYIFNGIQDRYTGYPAHAILWPDIQQPSALIPEGYITGAWFPVSLPPGGSQELVLYHLPHDPGPAYEAYAAAELWAEVIKNGSDPDLIGHLSGTVTDSLGSPSPGVSLEALDANGQPVMRAAADSEGRYSLSAPMSDMYKIRVHNGYDSLEWNVPSWLGERMQEKSFVMDGPDNRIVAGMTKGDPGFTYDGTSRDWWPAHTYYYIESPDIKFTVGTVRTAGRDPVDWSNDASGNNKWGSLTPGHIMDAVPRLTMQENLDFSEFVLSDDLGVTPGDEASGKHMEWSWFHPLTKLTFPDIRIDGKTIAAEGSWDDEEDMKSSVTYSIVDNSPLIRMDLTIENQTGSDFDGHLGYIIDPDQPGEQQSYLPGHGWVYGQEKNIIEAGWTGNYLFNGVNHAFTGKTAHAILWPQDQQPAKIMHEAIFMGVWLEAEIPHGESRDYVFYHMPHLAGPADRPYAVAEFWANWIAEEEDAAEYGSIVGTVTDENGAPVAFTELVVTDANGDEYARTVSTAEGKYQIYAKQGEYEIQPLHEEYSVGKQEVILQGNGRETVDFVMKKYAEVTLQMPEVLTPMVPFPVDVEIHNLTEEDQHNLTVVLQAPYFIEWQDNPVIGLPLLEANETAELSLQAVALEGGRAAVQVMASTDIFRVSGSRSFNVTGSGYYSGDSHSHTQHSDGVHSVWDNSASVYDHRYLSWIWSTDHNTSNQADDAGDVTDHYDGTFLSLSGTEITTSFGHALALGYEGLPRFDISDSPSGYTWQNSIDDVTNEAAAFYMAHPFDQTYTFLTPYLWRGFTGIEVWNGTWHGLDQGVNEQGFRFWDEINIRGEAKYFGIANSDAHTKEKAGDPYSRGWLPDLAEEPVLDMLKTGGFFGSNGPELRFDIAGVGMGETLTAAAPGLYPVTLAAYDPHSMLTHIRLIRYPVTGDTADYEEREIVFEEDLTSSSVHSFQQMLWLPLADKEFYRLEVQSERAQPGSSGTGPLAGSGFAFSNPIWVEVNANGDSNAAAVEQLEYGNGSIGQVIPSFGIPLLEINDQQFDLNELTVQVSDGASVTDIQWTALFPGDPAKGLLQITVTADNGSERAYSYRTRLVFSGE